MEADSQNNGLGKCCVSYNTFWMETSEKRFLPARPECATASVTILSKFQARFSTWWIAGGDHITDTLHQQDLGKHWDNKNLKVGQIGDNLLYHSGL